MLVGVQVEEQLLDLVDDLGRAGVGAVDLVDADHHRQPPGQRLAEHVAGLGQRALAGVDQQQHGVDHPQGPLDLAAEVGVAGVSTTLTRTPRNSTAVCLARMVMPFSRSRSIESRTRSTTSWLARNTPDWRSMASTRVVLPWSTCATMAMLRRSLRIAGTMPA